MPMSSPQMIKMFGVSGTMSLLVGRLGVVARGVKVAHPAIVAADE